MLGRILSLLSYHFKHPFFNTTGCHFAIHVKVGGAAVAQEMERSTFRSTFCPLSGQVGGSISDPCCQHGRVSLGKTLRCAPSHMWIIRSVEMICCGHLFWVDIIVNVVFSYLCLFNQLNYLYRNYNQNGWVVNWKCLTQNWVELRWKPEIDMGG